MSLTLGEKLRQAREERGISIMEVSEQTRISPLYLEAIENDNYSPLPGGIFNKGFVKTFAKYVGIDENEALQDYTRLVTQQTGSEENVDPQTYRPEVLTDDRASSSNILTIVFAVVILGLMTWGILALVNYIQDQQNAPVVSNSNTANTNADAANTNSVNTNTAQTIPATNEIKVEIKTAGEPIQLSYSIEDTKSFVNSTVTTDKPLLLNPQQKVRLNYYKTFGPLVQLTVNGKQIAAPTVPIPPKRNAIEYEINKENIRQILESGQITTDTPAPNTNANTTR